MRPVFGQQAKLSFQQKRALLAELIGTGPENVGLYPLSLAQQRLWFLEQLEPGTAAHNLPSGLRLVGRLDFQALRRALSGIVARHESLRTAFITVRDGVFQRTSPSAHIELPIVDLRALPEDAREADAYHIAGEEARRLFDLERGPLLRLKLIRVGEEDHILIITMHHLVSDGWSMGVFVEELTQLYEAYSENRESPLPPIPIQYAQYTQWQRESLAGGELERQIQYWKTRLAGIPSLLELPTDGVRTAEQSFVGGVFSTCLPPALVERLKALAEREGVTRFTVLLAALNVLMYRYTNEEDLCIGIPVAGRGHLETEALIGLFVNTLVIRTDLSGNPSFRDVLAQVWEVWLEANANQDLPFERVVEELQPKRSLAYNPIFQVMMTALKAPLRNRSFGALTVSPYVIGTGTSRFDLAASITETVDGALIWQFEYNAALSDQARIRRMIGHYQTLLNSICERPEQRIGHLALLTAEEQQQFSIWNDTAAKYPGTSVHTLIADQAASSPDSVAVVFEDRRLTYAELHDQAQRIAAALRAAGAGPGSRVAVCLKRSLEMIAGLLGILHTGAAYVPVDPEYPAERVSAMVASAGVALLLTQRELMVRLPSNLNRRVLIEDALDMSPMGAPAPVDPESLAYIIFTSGSTGRPNGVCISHRSLVNLLTSMRREPGLTADDKLLAVTNLCFDISALELLLPLITGAQLVIASAEEVVDGPKLLENIRRNSVTTMQATPSTWRLLAGAGWSRAACKLRVLCGGEALSPGIANQLMELSDSVWNLYGPTETTIWSGLSRLRKGHPITIGRPICNTQFFVLDCRMQRVPVGIPGELYIGGDGLAKGYIDRPELSNERFVPNPFDSARGILYRTGDEVRYCADGEIEYLRRLDTQVKLRGFRIELSEVESVVAGNVGVQQAVAMVREDTPGDARLVCYVVPERDAELSAFELRAAIRNSLPEYMVPMLVYVESIPLTANGKIDRTRFPVPIEKTPGGVGLPRNAAEKKLLLIWKKVLRLKGLGIQDNFFDMGGHSLLVIELLAEIKRVFGKQLPVSTVFNAQTIEEMAAVISQDSLNPFVSLVAIQSQGHRRALYVIPGSGGTVFEFAELARLLGSDQPVYGLQSIGLDGEAEPLERIEDIAKNFVGEIRRLQPRGPYHLAGFCIGGLVAFEMAQQLIASGEEAPVLALVETWFPSSIPALQGPPAPLRPFIFLIRGLLRHLGAMLRLPPGQAIHYFRQKSAIIREMVRHRDIYRGEWSASYKNLVIEANYRAGSRYVPAPLPGRLLLFLAANRNGESDEELLVWSRLARQSCPVFRISGEDVNDLIRSPYVQELAAKLREQLDESIAREAEQVA